MSDIQITRLKRKIEKRDKRIKGLENKIDRLERKLAKTVIDLPKTVEQSVTDAFMNVRFMPIHKFMGKERIVEVREFNKDT